MKVPCFTEPEGSSNTISLRTNWYTLIMPGFLKQQQQQHKNCLEMLYHKQDLVYACATQVIHQFTMKWNSSTSSLKITTTTPWRLRLFVERTSRNIMTQNYDKCSPHGLKEMDIKEPMTLWNPCTYARGYHTWAVCWAACHWLRQQQQLL